MIYTSKEAEQKAVYEVANKMIAAARTAPKGRGIDNIEAIIVDGEDKDSLASKMREIAIEVNGEGPFERDSHNIDSSQCVVLIGVKNIPVGLRSYCGMCGFENCSVAVKAGSSCAFNTVDLGIALGSAVSIAADNRIDNRIFYSIGKAALEKGGFFPENVRAAFGIPLSTSGKSIFYDRG